MGGGWWGKVEGGDILRGELEMTAYYDKYRRHGVMGHFHLQKNSEIFYWEFPFGKSAFHLLQVPF